MSDFDEAELDYLFPRPPTHITPAADGWVMVTVTELGRDDVVLVEFLTDDLANTGDTVDLPGGGVGLVVGMRERPGDGNPYRQHLRIERR